MGCIVTLSVVDSARAWPYRRRHQLMDGRHGRRTATGFGPRPRRTTGQPHQRDLLHVAPGDGASGSQRRIGRLDCTELATHDDPKARCARACGAQCMARTTPTRRRTINYMRLPDLYAKLRLHPHRPRSPPAPDNMASGLPNPSR